MNERGAFEQRRDDDGVAAQLWVHALAGRDSSQKGAVLEAVCKYEQHPLYAKMLADYCRANCGEPTTILTPTGEVLTKR